MTKVRVELPGHLRTLARVDGEVEVEVPSERPTFTALLDALETKYPTLRGTIREHGTGERRAYMRFFACDRDLSFEPLDAPLPDRVASGEEALRIVGAIAGG